MIIAENISKSTKRMGLYEEQIIRKLTDYFLKEGYDVIPHSSLNIAWGSVLSDIDLLLVKDQLLTYVEVKSSRDNLARAHKQIDRVMDYVDYAYVATDKKVRKWSSKNAGLIFVGSDKISMIKKGKRFKNKPRFYSVVTLKKKCLDRFFDNQCLIFENKYNLAEYVYAKKECNRPLLKEIVTCGYLCSSNCPLVRKYDLLFL
jgi:hypothetical protein